MAWVMCKPLSMEELLWSLALDANTPPTIVHCALNSVPVQSISKQHQTQMTLSSQKDVASSDVDPQMAKVIATQMHIVFPASSGTFLTLICQDHLFLRVHRRSKETGPCLLSAFQRRSRKHLQSSSSVQRTTAASSQTCVQVAMKMRSTERKCEPSTWISSNQGAIGNPQIHISW